MTDYCEYDYILRDGTDSTVVRIDWGEELVLGTCKSCSTSKYILPVHSYCEECFLKLYKCITELPDPKLYDEERETETRCSVCGDISRRRVCKDCKFNLNND
jgi:hypothetical protein